MAKRIGYGRLADVSPSAGTTGVRERRLRNQLNKDFASYIRDADGNCFKAVIAGGNFTWIEIDDSEYEAAAGRGK